MSTKWKPLYLLISNSKVHSAHLALDKAKSWKECQEHNGDDTQIITIDDEDVLLSLHDKLTEMFGA